MADPMLDLTTTPPEAQYEALQRAFDALEPGATLTVTTPGDPRKLLQQLIAARWGRFVWAPLRAGEGGWRGELRRRTAPGAPGLSEFMTGDHRRCDGLYAEAEAAAQAGDVAAAQACFASLELGMLRHFRMEEEGFFPEFDRRMGMMGQGPTVVMREEHTQMRGVLRRMAAALADGDLDTFAGAAETLLLLMEQHNMKEEQMLYPMADQAFGGEADALLRQLQLY